LDAVIRSANLSVQTKQCIHLINGSFSEYLLKTIEFAKSKQHKQRCIFLLDQYGYSDVPFTEIRKIFEHFQTAEVILTFSTDALINYICEENQDQHNKIFKELGLHESLNIKELIETKETTPEWRYVIESQLIHAIKTQSGAKHFTPFFIVSRKSHRAYWLVHLSMHPRAQDEMTRLHWKFNNYFQHYGKPGMNMLGYDPAQDVSLKDQLSLEFMFDSNARQMTHDSLSKDIPMSLHQYENGIDYERYFSLTCNDTPADDALYREVLTTLLQEKEIEIIGEHGEVRRSGHSVRKTDVISLPRQKKFIFT